MIEGGDLIMAKNIRNVSKAHPCPICGKPDWCGYMPASDGGELVICQRDVEQANAIGLDGQFYVVVGISKNGITIFEEANQRRAKELARDGSKSNYNNFSKVKIPEVKTLTVVDQVIARSNKELDTIYRTMLSFLSLEPVHREYLHKEGWTDEMIRKNNIVSFPEKDFSRFKYRKNVKFVNPYRKRLATLVMNKLEIDNLRGVPGAYRDAKENWTFAGRSGIFFPQPDINHLIYRLRLRMDFRDINSEIHSNTNGDDWYIDKGKKYYIHMGGIYQVNDKGKKEYDKSIGKYRNFASYYIDKEEEKRGFLVNVYNEGCEAGNQLAFYYNEQRDDMHIVYATEGEKKGMFSNEILRAPFISFPGINSWSLLFDGKVGERPVDILKKKGVNIFIIAFDADKSINKRVLAAEQQTIEALRKEGFIIGIAEWDMKIGKGLDDLLSKGYKPEFIAV